MKNSKYIKVSVSDRLPDESTELYFYCNDGYCNAGDYNKDLNSFTDLDGARYSTEYIDYWLQEVPDYEEEMKKMLERVINAFETDYVVDGEIVDKPYEWLQDVYKETKSLLTKLKTES